MYAILYKSATEVLVAFRQDTAEIFNICNNFLFVKDNDLNLKLTKFCYVPATK
jgi:hypothetical protein